jgi:hypothetical protein
MVTHSSTSRPVQCLCMAERTGCPVLTDLWSYVAGFGEMYVILLIPILHDLAERRSPAQNVRQFRLGLLAKCTPKEDEQHTL